MGRNRRASREKKIKPHFWVFCEGKTEEAYICFLRSKFRIPIEIVPKVLGNKINERIIKSYKKGKPIHKKDIDFLLYDADISEILNKLKKIKSSVLLVSNPSIELWFLLHYKNQTAHITTQECIKQLNNRNRNIYKKGLIDKKLKGKLDENCTTACNRASQKELYKNPSSNIYDLITILEDTKSNNL